MADIYMDVDTAVIVPVNILPLIDDTDFKTIETAVVYNSAGMAVTWNFVTSAGVQTGTAITPTTAGVYDWSEPIADKGMYAIEIPASAGISANNDTEGYGWISGVATGVLPWRGPVICFRAAALNDALCDGGDNLDVNTVQWLGTACATPTVAGVPEVDLTHVAGVTTNVAALATNVDAILTDTGTTLDTKLNNIQGTTFDTATDSLEALRNRGDAAWITAVGFSTHSAANVRTEMDANSTKLANLDATITSRMATYTQPTGFLAATFPTTVASPTNITAATGITVSTNSDKTGYSLSQAFPSNFSVMSISPTTGLVDITQTAADKSWSTAARVLTAGTNINLPDQTMNITGTITNVSQIAAVAVVADAVTRLNKSYVSVVTGIVGAASTTTSIVTSSLDPAASVTDQFKGKIVTFAAATTTAALRGQSTDITASTAGGVLTVTALTTAPVSGDIFVIT